jgi:hypothetical protein
VRPVRVSERAAILRGLPHAVILRSLRRHVPQAPPPLRTCPQGDHQADVVHCKKRLTIFPSPAVMTLTKLSLAGTGKSLPFFTV